MSLVAGIDLGSNSFHMVVGRVVEGQVHVIDRIRDGVRLATDVYTPKGEGPWPVVFVKTPYNFNKIRGTQAKWAARAIENGYAFVVQNERGRYYSGRRIRTRAPIRSRGW